MKEMYSVTLRIRENNLFLLGVTLREPNICTVPRQSQDQSNTKLSGRSIWSPILSLKIISTQSVSGLQPLLLLCQVQNTGTLKRRPLVWLLWWLGLRLAAHIGGKQAAGPFSSHLQTDTSYSSPLSPCPISEEQISGLGSRSYSSQDT